MGDVCALLQVLLGIATLVLSILDFKRSTPPAETGGNHVNEDGNPRRKES